jgi:hypothetical protein
LVHEVLDCGAQAVDRGDAQCVSQLLDRNAQGNARGATQVLPRGAQAVARGAARCLLQVLNRCAMVDARGAAQALDRGAQADGLELIQT